MCYIIDEAIEIVHRLAMALPEDPALYCNPAVTLVLPFLGSPNSVQLDRMNVCSQGTFPYYGRSEFERICQASMAMRKFGCTKYLLNGGLGVGKTHILAALACFLTRIGKRVAFLPDCRALVKAPLYGLQFALKFAFYGFVEEQEYIAKINTLDEIYEFCRKVSSKHRIYFLIDQCNALDYIPQGTDRVGESSKAVVRTLLDQITEHHFKISSATANYQHGARDQLRNSSENGYFIHHGLSEVQYTLIDPMSATFR